MSKLSKVAVVLALVLSLGAHWTILQSVAWVSMIVKFSEQDSLMVAVNKTFDGKHPCSICLFIAAGKKSEQQKENPYSIQISKMDCVLEDPLNFRLSPWLAPPPPASDEERPARVESPPFPPPRLG